jgi:hypothetical protein
VTDLAANERWLDSTEALLIDAPPEGVSALVDDRRAAISEIAEIGIRWKRACDGWFATNLPGGTAVLTGTKNYVVAPLPDYPVPVGVAYIARLAEFAVEQGLSLDDIDPTGATSAAAEATVGGLLASPDGQIVLRAIEVTNNSADWDNDLSENDAMRATDRQTAETEIRRTLARLGITDVDDEAVAQLTALAQQSGWILKSTWSDDVDDRVDAQLEAWAQPGGPAGSDVEFAEIAADAATEVIPSGIDVAAPNLMVTEGLTAGELAGRFGLGADVIMTVGDIVNGEDATPAVLSLAGETLVWSALPSSAPVVLVGGVAIFLGMMWVADQAPAFYPDWSGMDTGPGKHPYQMANEPVVDAPQIAPNGWLGPMIDCAAIEFYGGSHEQCGDNGGLTPVND